MTQITGYYQAKPASLSAFARAVASKQWGPEINDQRQLKTQVIDGYLGDFDTPSHGGYVVVSRSELTHSAVQKYKLTGDLWPNSYGSRQYRVAVLNIPTSLHVYAFEEDCAWAALVVAYPEIAKDLAASFLPGVTPEYILENAQASFRQYP